MSRSSMTDGSGWDVARQGATVVGALFQVLAGLLLPFPGEAGGSGGAPVRSTIQPADYAFTVWAPIFLLCLLYAAYQAFPASRESALLRRVGWFAAGAFFCTGAFEVLVSLQQFVLAQAFIVGIFGCVGVAYLRLVRSERGVLGVADRWLVALPLGLFFGWITAATLVTVDGALAFLGLPPGGIVGAASGVVLLLLGGLLASSVVVASRSDPAQGYLAYGGAVLWALVGVVVGQYQASAAISLATIAAAALVAAVLFATLWRPDDGRGDGQPFWVA